MTRTSRTDPLRIDALSVASGQVGLTICPGKRGASALGEPWARDLDADIAVIAAWRAQLVVTLMESDELAAHGVAQLGAAVTAAGLTWRHVPIADLSVPDERAMRCWRRISPGVHRQVAAGGRVLVHCLGGLGRSGLIATLILIERGVDPAAALEVVRAARPGAVETAAQERWLDACAHP